MQSIQMLKAPRNLARRLSTGPMKDLHGDFQNVVRSLKRPYLKLSDAQLQAIQRIARESDTVLFDGKTLMTYGEADGGYALMPISQPANTLASRRD